MTTFDSSSTLQAMDRSVNVEGTSGTANAAAATTGGSASSSTVQTVSCLLSGLSADIRGIFLDPRAHSRVAILLSLFSVVEVTRVQMYVFQRSVKSADPDGTYVPELRFGLVPRGTPAAIKSGSKQVGVVDDIPHLMSMVLHTNCPATTTVVWGEGGIPFPPGLQLDLAATELRHRYLNVFLGNVHPDEKDKTFLAAAQVDITYRCSGDNFGLNTPLE